mmetsp:Transcript_31029/g.90494  ORF Transcript_31029/g.90494 Transcript_31029/m.90494 type:complete len:287 (+) Transcript_31029:605-1465(+)
MEAHGEIARRWVDLLPKVPLGGQLANGVLREIVQDAERGQALVGLPAVPDLDGQRELHVDLYGTLDLHVALALRRREAAAAAALVLDLRPQHDDELDAAVPLRVALAARRRRGGLGHRHREHVGLPGVLAAQLPPLEDPHVVRRPPGRLLRVLLPLRLRLLLLLPARLAARRRLAGLALAAVVLVAVVRAVRRDAAAPQGLPEGAEVISVLRVDLELLQPREGITGPRMRLRVAADEVAVRALNVVDEGVFLRGRGQVLQHEGQLALRRGLLADHLASYCDVFHTH